ncbi:MAG TPA: hypothetical protein DIU11_10850, partial [Pusillimonas sp.]|nr:hypothetical protein [Pusillimonas sp.]
NLETEETIPAADIRAQDEAFLDAVHKAAGVTRDDEMSPANQGKALPDFIDAHPARNTRGKMTEATT